MHRSTERLTTPDGMLAAALIAQQRRGVDNSHRIILGGLRAVGSRVVLFAVECGPAYNIIRPIQLTDDFRRFYKWRTRQAAMQFAERWQLDDVHAYDLDYADVLVAGVESE